jgi:hypothetical protein
MEPFEWKVSYLRKRSSGAAFYGLLRVWQKRYFVLRDGQLEWFKNSKCAKKRGGFFVGSICAIQVNDP